MNESETVSTAEAAELLDIRVRDLYRLIDEGQIPAVKLNRRICIRRDDLPA